MDILLSCRQLIEEMILKAGPQIKIFLMDKITTSIISCAYAQSEIMQKEVYLFDQIDSIVPRESIGFMKCIVFIRPTRENIKKLVAELRSPKYSQYYIYFSNVVNKSDVKSLAEADENEMVREVHEFFMDGIPLRRDLHCLNVTKIYAKQLEIMPHCFDRMKQGLIALLLQLKKCPAIRYQSTSSDCNRLAEDIAQFIRRENELFENCNSDAVVVIIDRYHDPATPLLNQWTYEAMIHELITIHNNRVTVDNQSMVLSEIHDEFFANNITANFGEIGQNIKTLVNEFQERQKINTNLESISDMKKFVEDYPQFKKISGTVSKHVTLVEELSKIVKNSNLLELSEIEQSIVAQGDHSSCLERIKSLLNKSSTSKLDALRLIILYALRFESNPNNEISALTSSLQYKDPNSATIVRNFLRYGNSRRSVDLFGSKSTIDITKRIFKGLKGVENIYTQHEPYLKKVIDHTIKHRNEIYTLKGNDVQCYDNIIVFIIGGATYEEAALVRKLNQRRSQGYGGPSIILSSNEMLNAKTFINQMSTI